MQILGAMAGAGLVAALTPNTVRLGMGDGAPGCFDGKTASQDISKAQVFGWEVRDGHSGRVICVILLRASWGGVVCNAQQQQ